jgi:hypothetical protein
MKHHPLKHVKYILVLLLSILGLSMPIPAGSAEERPVVLMIARSAAPYDGERSLKVAIDKEDNAIIDKLNGL